MILFITSLASYISIQNLIKSADLVSHSNKVMSSLDGVISSLKDAETGQRGYLLTGNKEFLDPYIGAEEQAKDLLNTVAIETADNSFQQQNVKALQEIVENRLSIIEKTIREKELGANVGVAELLEGKVYMDDARSTIKKMQTEEQRILAIRTQDLNKISSYTPTLILIAAALAILITIFFYRKVSSDFTVRLKLQKELRDQNEQIAIRIEMIRNIAGRISDGDYHIRLDEKEKDGLGSLAGSLNAMAESLQYSFSLLADKEWLQSGIAGVNDKVVGEKKIEILAHDVLEEIVVRTKSAVAAFYLIGDDKNLHLEGSYALKEDTQKSIIKPGEGIVGEVVKSKKPIVITDIPDGEMTISYASGATKATSIAAIPVKRNNLLVGVIELGTLGTFNPIDLEFLNSVSENVAIAIHVAQNRKRMQELLEETQAQAEELQAQHTELESMNTELEAQSQKIQTSEEELRVQQEELLQSNQELEERTSLLEEKNQLIQERNIDIQQKAEQLELSTKYKSEFLANMSHELRTPLNSILLLSRLMSENKDLDEEYIEYAEVIQSSGQGLLGLIDEILDLLDIDGLSVQGNDFIGNPEADAFRER